MLKLAYRNLRSRPARSILALLGLTVAIAGMVGLFSVASGLDRLVNSTFEQIPGLVAVQPGAPVPLFSTLPAAWGEEIKRVPGVRLVNPEVWQRVNLINEKFIVSPPRFLFGTDIATRLELSQATYRDAMLPGQGRYLTRDDIGTKNALVSRQIADEFHAKVGDQLNVNGHEITIVGVYHTGSMLLDVAIVMDIDQVRSITRFNPESVSSYYIEPTGDVPEADLIAAIQKVFEGRALEQWNPASALGAAPSGGGLSALVGQIAQNLARPPAANGGASNPPEPKSSNGVPHAADTSAGASTAPGAKPPSTIEVRSARDWSEKIDDFSDDLDLFLTLMTTIAVTIAVLSIINTMLMSVSERITEFGVLKANGWTQWDVAKLITWESALLGFGGGVLGCIAGWIATLGINAAWPDRIYLYAGPGLIAFGLAFSVSLGVIGGLYPAIWAMRMAPMEAIRRA